MIFSCVILLVSCIRGITNDGFAAWNKFEALDYPSCPNIECKISVFEYCAAASIGKIFEEYLNINGFTLEAYRKGEDNTKLRIALINNTESKFCSGLIIQRHLLSLMNTQNVEKSGVAIDLLSLLQKTELHKSIHQYSFWPLSYSMSNKKQRRKFFKNLQCEPELSEPWIFKSNQHKGKGIIFLDNAFNIRKLFITDDDLKYGLSHDCDRKKAAQRLSIVEIQQIGFQKDHIDHISHIVKGEHYIAQKYIGNTLLINGRKCGIRVFIVVLSLNPYIVLFSDGYISINAQIFDEENINKINVLSNREMSQKQSEFEKEWNWSYQQFDEYLKSQNDIHFDMDYVRTQLISAANMTFQAIVRKNGKFSKSTRKKLKKYLPIALSKGIISKDDNNYMWLAIDFLLTVDGNVKLLEINLHPGTRIFDHCSWVNTDKETYDDWQCQQARNITKEIVDVTFEMAYRKANGMPWTEGILQNILDFHSVLIFRDF